jgi:NitT/TauT family transport system ATP-binding protein
MAKTETNRTPQPVPSGGSPDAFLAADRISKYYGEGSKRIQVLKDISFEVHEGEIVVVLGPSGAGKSTLMRILAGLSEPDGGRVLFRGQEQHGPNANFAMVFQNFALFPWLTVYENVEVGVLNADISENQRRRRVLKAIDLIGLDGFEDAYPNELSLGMRQRVGFARALVVQPQILLMDEPFSALDVLTADNLKKELLSLWRSKDMPTRAILMVSHNIDEAVAMGDRLLVMGHDPGTIRVDMQGLAPDERGKDNPEHIRLVDYLYQVMTNPTERVPPFRPEAPAAQPEAAPLHTFQVLPRVDIGQITGLIERLHSGQDREDIYAVGRDLNMEADDLLGLVQAIDILGLGDIDAGDIYLTPAGIRFAEAGVQDRKRIFSEQAHNSVQLVRKILHDIQASPNGRVRWDDLMEVLEHSFSTEEAERQLETATDWGRYAELFNYDDSEGVFELEAKEYVPETTEEDEDEDEGNSAEPDTRH